MEMTDRMLYCLDLNLSTSYFRVGSRNPVLFKTKLFVTSLSNSFQPLCIFCQKELHLRCFIGLELNIVTSRKIVKNIGVTPMFRWNLGKILVGHPHDQVEPWENMKTHLPRCLKIQFPEGFHVKFVAFNVNRTK